MKAMTKQEIKDFLSQSRRTGKVGVVRSDGRPHVTPVWFILDGEDVVFTTWHESIKARHLKRDPRICLCVDEETPPYSFVMVEGTAEISRNPDQLFFYARRIAGRYIGEDQADAYGKRNSVEGELLVRITPTHIVAKKEVAA